MWKINIFSILFSFCFILPVSASETRTITDMAGRSVEIPTSVDKVICSGPGCLRYLIYLEGQDLVVGVDSIEKRINKFDARPYAIANPQLKKLPLFGEFRGFDNPELILGLNPQPQVIFKTFKNMGYDPDELQAKTGIPVICLVYGNLASERQKIYDSLNMMAEVIGHQDRAKQVEAFFEKTISDLESRTANIPEDQRRSCYIGGVAKKGPHGFQSTEPAYPPFRFVNAKNIACPPEDAGKPLQHTNVSKEQIISWNPEVIFIDLATTQLGKNAGAINELTIEPAYQGLTAVQNGKIYSLLPYNWYTRNYGSILANAFYVGKVLYPERFADVDPKVKADEIYSFLVGKPVFSHMDTAFGSIAFEKIELH
jgi:iron complex transport system substrate-binding protein